MSEVSPWSEKTALDKDFLDYRKQTRYSGLSITGNVRLAMGAENVGERIVPTDPQEIDAALLARLLLGAQSEHEQRLVATRLLSRDAACRSAVAAIVEPFEMFDLGFVAEYAAVLEQGRRDVDERRREILGRASARADLEELLRHFTYADVLKLGEVTRQLFTWTMAETLLGRTRRVGIADHDAATCLYLSLMVIDVVEILGVVGHSPQFPGVVRDVRRRITKASRSLRPFYQGSGDRTW